MNTFATMAKLQEDPVAMDVSWVESLCCEEEDRCSTKCKMTFFPPGGSPRSVRSPTKSVSFSETVRVVLIPSRDDVQAANLACILWSSAFDFSCSKQTAFDEIQSIMAYNAALDAKDIMSLLYQPPLTCSLSTVHVLVVDSNPLVVGVVKKQLVRAFTSSRVIVQHAISGTDAVAKSKGTLHYDMFIISENKHATASPDIEALYLPSLLQHSIRGSQALFVGLLANEPADESRYLKGGFDVTFSKRRIYEEALWNNLPGKLSNKIEKA